MAHLHAVDAVGGELDGAPRCLELEDLLGAAELVAAPDPRAPQAELEGLTQLAFAGAAMKAAAVNAHDVAQLREVLDQRPDYVAFGPVFPTRSKQNPDAVVGLDQLAEVHALTSAAGIPLVGIGGITRERASAVSCRAESGAVIGDLLAGGGGEIAARASELQRLLSA